MENFINSFATSCYRIIFAIRRIDRVSNQAVLFQIDLSPLIQTVTGFYACSATGCEQPIFRFQAMSYMLEEGRNWGGQPRLNLLVHQCHDRKTDRSQQGDPHEID